MTTNTTPSPNVVEATLEQWVEDGRLPSCGLCGSESVTHDIDDGQVSCDNCGLAAPIDCELSGAVENWIKLSIALAALTPAQDDGLVGELEHALDEIQQYDRPIPWVVHTGCSFRRVASQTTPQNPRSFPDGNVLQAIRQSDGHLDLSMGEKQLEALVSIVNNLPRALTALRASMITGLRDEPVAVRYDFDGYGWKYLDSGSGGDWLTRIPDAEPLFAKDSVKGTGDE